MPRSPQVRAPSTSKLLADTIASSPTSRRNSRAAARYTAGCGLKAPAASTEITASKATRMRPATNRCR